MFIFDMEDSSRFLNTGLIHRHKKNLRGLDVRINKKSLFKNISNNLKKNNATIISHYYVDPLIQEITESTGGFVGDSLEMTKFGRECNTDHKK